MAKTWRYPVILPTTGTSGSFNVKPPFAVDHIGVINTTAANLYVSEGQVYTQPPESILFSQNVAMTSPLNAETNIITVFWNSGATPLGTTNNQAIIILSDEPINLQAGVNSSGGVASNVNVQNTISATLTGTNNVTLQSSGNLAGRFSISDSSGTKEPNISTLTDGQSNSFGLSVLSRLQGFNGTSFDMLRVDSQKNLLVGIRDSSGNGPTVNYVNADSISPSQTALNTVSFGTGFDGTSWQRLRVDSQKNLLVGLRNSAGTEPNISSISVDTVTPGNGLQTLGFLHGYSGTGWDRLRVDANKNLQVSLRNSAGVEPSVYSTSSDGMSLPSGLSTLSVLTAYNGTTLDRLRVDSAKNLNVTANGMSATPSTAQVTVGTTAVQLKVGASDLANRKTITFRNKGSVTIYIGGSGVTTATGYAIEPGEQVSFDQQPGATAPIYAISGTAGQSVHVMEVA